MSSDHTFTKHLLAWHRDIDRGMPWKNTKDPYLIWISEVILQQTRVAQGTSYYERFIDRFPDINALAEASIEEVLKMWEGLGYYSRARNLHHASQDIMTRFGGVFPSKYEDILSLKGIGTYTAAAISSFAYNLPHPVIDGNVFRVLTRYFGIHEPIDTTIGKKMVAELANEVFDIKRPASYNQAIMDFGALVCTPKKVKCGHCPVQSSCTAQNEGTVAILPIKSKKIKVNNRYLYYFLYVENEKILINQRTNGDIWAKLYELPLIESTKQISLDDLKKEHFYAEDIEFVLVNKSKHKLTHQLLHISFISISSISANAPFESCRLEKVKELAKFAFPKPIKTFLELAL